MDTLRENIFIPTSGRSSALTRILPQLTNVLRSHPHFDMHLFGYPEWQTYTQEHLASFYELDTYFYSSFYTNNLFPELFGSPKVTAAGIAKTWRTLSPNTACWDLIRDISS